MNLLQGTGTGAHLLLCRATSGLALHPPLADEDDVSIGELLLELLLRAREKWWSVTCGS